MIDTSKQYTYNGKPVRIYADGSDTFGFAIHGAIKYKDGWHQSSFNESDLVEVWEPKEGELCYFWDDYNTNIIVVARFNRIVSGDMRYESIGDANYKHCAPFKGELPEAFKGLV